MFAGIPRDSPLLQRRVPPAPNAVDAATCSLHFICSKVFLISFLQGSQHELASHFLKHYIESVGVLPSHIRALIHSPGGDDAHGLGNTLQHFVQAGVPNASLQLFSEGFAESSKLKAINNVIRALPTDAWVINADIDEFFTYPCNLRQQIQTDRHEVFCGEMRDRLSASGDIAELHPAREGSPSIGAQFPRYCYVRQHWRNAASSNAAISKVVLMRVARADGSRRAFVDPHHVTGYRRYGMRCRAIGYFSHFTLTMQAMRATREVKLAGHCDVFCDRQHRGMYRAIAAFMASASKRGASTHPWCNPPPRAAENDVTTFTNSLLDYCHVPLTVLGDVRAV